MVVPMPLSLVLQRAVSSDENAYAEALAALYTSAELGAGGATLLMVASWNFQSRDSRPPWPTLTSRKIMCQVFALLAASEL